MPYTTTDPGDKSHNGCIDCAQDPIGGLRELFAEIVQAKRIRLGQNPALRAVFLKPHGVAHGWFVSGLGAASGAVSLGDKAALSLGCIRPPV